MSYDLDNYRSLSNISNNFVSFTEKPGNRNLRINTCFDPGSNLVSS